MNATTDNELIDKTNEAPEAHQATYLLNNAKVRRLAHEHGKRVSEEFLAQLEGWLRRKIEAACKVHNGGKKTLDTSDVGIK
jgi:hypothetical protein